MPIFTQAIKFKITT